MNPPPRLAVDSRPAGCHRRPMRHHCPFLLPALAALAALVHAPRVSATEARVFRDESGGALPYRWHAPTAPEPGRRYPLVLFLHGAGERGDDNQAQLRHGVPDILKWADQHAEPCFLIAPQCPAEEWWAAIDRQTKEAPARAEATAPMRRVLALLEQVAREHPVDPARLYVTGLSMGGFGTWFLLATVPERIAAAVPVCGGGNPASAPAFSKVPVWVFHGARDEVVPVASSRNMVEALRKAGGNPKFTEYPEAHHDSWTATYRDPEVLRWMFQQRRPAK